MPLTVSSFIRGPSSIKVDRSPGRFLRSGPENSLEAWIEATYSKTEVYVEQHPMAAGNVWRDESGHPTIPDTNSDDGVQLDLSGGSRDETASRPPERPES